MSFRPSTQIRYAGAACALPALAVAAQSDALNDVSVMTGDKIAIKTG
jgi:hypothetical protein